MLIKIRQGWSIPVIPVARSECGFVAGVLGHVVLERTATLRAEASHLGRLADDLSAEGRFGAVTYPLLLEC